MARVSSLIEEEAKEILNKKNKVQSPNINGEWTQIENEDIPTKGKFYREVWVKPLDVKTVRSVASIDPNNAQATLKGMCDILSNNCYIIDLKGNKVDGSNLKRADSLAVLLIIRELTYDDDLKLSLSHPVKCGVCGKDISQVTCDKALEIKWPSKLDEIAKIDEDGFILYNNISYHLPSIKEVYLFISVLISDDTKLALDEITTNDASLLLYICPIVNNINNMHKAIVEASTQMYSMNLKDLSKFRKFVQFLDKNIGIDPYIDVSCPYCGGDVKIPFSIGLDDICLASIEDF